MDTVDILNLASPDVFGFKGWCITCTANRTVGTSPVAASASTSTCSYNLLDGEN